jgi:hypothetical protein
MRGRCAPSPRGTVGRGFFLPNLEGWIKNYTSALSPVDAAAVTLTCRQSRDVFAPAYKLQTISSQRRTKKLAISGRNSSVRPREISRDAELSQGAGGCARQPVRPPVIPPALPRRRLGSFSSVATVPPAGRSRSRPTYARTPGATIAANDILPPFMG